MFVHKTHTFFVSSTRVFKNFIQEYLDTSPSNLLIFTRS